MAEDMSLNILINARNNAAGVFGDLARSMGGFGGVLLGVGAALAGVGVVLGISVKKAADFQQAMLGNVAHAGLAKSEFDAVSQAVLNMSTQVGRSPTQLAEALYPILSAFSGIQNQSAKSALALDTLKMSFQTVAGSATDGTAVANAAVGTFNALGLATNNVSENTKRMTGLFDIMDKTVMLGNMQWDAYKGVVSKLAVSIMGTTITFKESQAALATMTNEGYNARLGATYLSNTFTTLAIKTDAMAKHAAKLHISFNESAYASMDLATKIEYLNTITDGNRQKLLALMGNNTIALKTFNALSIGIGSYRSNLDALNHSQGALAGSFATASQGFNFQMQQLKASLDAVLISLGTIFLPIVTKIVAAITPVVTAFAQWMSSANGLQAIIQPFAAFLGSVFVPVFDALRVGIGQAADAFHFVFDAVKQAQPAVQPLVDSFDRAKSVMSGVHMVVRPLFDSFDRGRSVLSGMRTFVQPLMDSFDRATGVFQHAHTAINPFIPLFQNLAGLAKTLQPTFQQIASIVGGQLASNFVTFQGIVKDLAAWWQSTMVPAIKQAMPGFEALAMTVMTKLVPALVQLWADGQKIIQAVLPVLIKAFMTFEPILVRVAGIIAGWLAKAIQFLIPYVLQASKEIVKFAQDIATRVSPIIVSLGKLITVLLDWLQANWPKIWGVLGPQLQAVWNILVGIIKIAWALISGIIKIGLDLISGNWSRAWNDFKDMLGGIWDGIVSIIRGGVNLVIDLINGMIGSINNIGIDIGPVHIHPSIPKIPHLASGGDITEPGLAFLHAGERVIPANVNRSSGGGSSSGGGDTNITMNITINGPSRQMADQFIDEISRRLRQKGNLVTWSSGGRAT